MDLAHVTLLGAAVRPVSVPRTVRIFVSYCHRDAEYLERDSLLGFLRGLEREQIELWTDRRIETGELWDETLRQRIADSDIALVLVSQAFLDSDYCQSVEIAGFLERSGEAGLVIVPVLLSPCEWQRHGWLSSRQFLPRDGQTLEELGDEQGRHDRVFLELREHLRSLAEDCRIRWPEGPAAAAPQGATLPCAAEVPNRLDIGERRQVTVLVVRVEAVAGERRLDPEDLLERMPPFIERAREIVEHFGGHVVEQETLGSEMIVCYGYPNAYEDDARRAVETALELLRQCPATSSHRPPGTVLRFGLHTGEAAVSYRCESPELSLAELPRQVAEIHRGGPADSVMLSVETHRLIRKHYHCLALTAETDDTRPTDAMSPRAKKRLYRVLAKADERPRGLGVGDGAPIGRQRELELLVDRWELAREGVGQVVLLVGEAGLGKTSLLEALKERLLAEPRTLLECRCSPDHAGSAFHPILDLSRRLMGDLVPDPRDAPVVGSADGEIVRRTTQLAELLRMPTHDWQGSLEQCAMSRGRHMLFELLQPLLEVARRRPLLLLVEDIEWCDPSTLELLSELAQQMTASPVLMLLTCRPGGEPSWDHPYHLTHLTLGRLARRHVEAMIKRQVRGRRLSPEVLEEIVARADGVPLFVEELTRVVLETDLGGDGQLKVPATLQSGLMARLDRLGTAKSVAQLAAALGREFDEEQLRSVSELDDDVLREALDRLVDAGLVHRRGWSPRAHYTFKHSLIREAAHSSLLRKQRRQVHRHIAFVFDDRYPELTRQCPECMAGHYEEAGLMAAALTCWRSAAEKAVREGASCEAIRHARRGLQVLEGLRLDPRLVEHEATLRIALGAALCSANGYACQEAEEAYRRAEDLVGSLDAPERRLPIVEALAGYQMQRGRVSRAGAMAAELVQMAEATGEGTAAHRTLGFALLMAGDLAGSRHHLEAGLADFSFGGLPRDHFERATVGGVPPAASLGDLSWVAWFEGRFSQALELSEASLATARKARDPFSLLYSLMRAGYLEVFFRQPQNARRLAGQLVAEARHRGSLVFQALGHMLDGITLALQGRSEEGSRKISHGLDGLWATGFGAGQPRNLTLLASVLGACGEVAEGLSLLRRAEEEIARFGAGLFEAEVHRIRAELMVLRGDPAAEVRRVFEQSLGLARERGALALALRAANSLVRAGEAAQAGVSDRQMLHRILRQFDGEIRTTDLQEARQLVDGAPFVAEG